MPRFPRPVRPLSYDTRDDGALQKGVAWPTPRFTDNGNGTVTDKLTGLIWMKNANAFGTKTWAEALNAANGLESGIWWPHGWLQAGRLAPAQRPGTPEPNLLWISNPALPAGPPFPGVQFGVLLVVDYQRSRRHHRLVRGFRLRRRGRLRQERHTTMCGVCEAVHDAG